MVEGETIEREPDLPIKLATKKEIRRAIEEKPRLFISIGPNFGTLPEPEKLEKDSAYVFYDTGYRDEPQKSHKGEMSYARDINDKDYDLWVTPLAKKGALFSNRSGADTELPDSSVDRIMTANLLNDPNTPKKIRKKIIKEAARILKPGGEVLISVTLTPEELPLKKIKKWAKKFGLTVEVSDDNGRKLIEDNNGELSIWRDEPKGCYAVRLVKEKKRN